MKQSSSNEYKPYTYLIGWSKLNKWYYGSQFCNSESRGIANPSNLWTTYFTSSKEVKKYRELYGEPDVVEVRKTFRLREQTKDWEEKVLIKMNVVKDDKWLNKNDTRNFIRDSGSMSEEHRRKIGLSNSIVLKGRKLSKEHIQNSANGNRGKKRGLTPKISEAKSKKWIVKFPDGREEVITNLQKFCDEHNLSSGTLCMTNRGTRKSHKGFSAKRVLNG